VNAPAVSDAEAGTRQRDRSPLPSNRPAAATVAKVDAGEEAQGRPTARFEREVLPHLDRLYSLALLSTSDSSAAEELVEETFTTAYGSFHQLDAGADPKAWLYRTLIATCRRRPRRERPPAAAAPTGEAEAVPQPGCGPARIEALRGLPDADVKHALCQLPEEVRVMVYLADVEGYTHTEIAGITAAPAPTVTAGLSHGRRQLRDRLQSHATAPVLVPR
jgi:RNA polymerase sigma-70 factor (ECF subfamily)